MIKKNIYSNNNSFFIPSENGFSRLEIKKSIFVTNLTKINTKIEAKNFIKNIKKTYDGAKHHCWVYIIGNPTNPYSMKSNDDGEPSRSATKPIINVLSQNNIGHVIVVITRYFGGIKLGVGGLRRAYSKSASMALSNVKLKRFYLQKIVKSLVPYNLEGLFLHILNKRGVAILDIQYRDLVIFKISLNEFTYIDFSENIISKTKGKVTFEVLSTVPNSKT